MYYELYVDSLFVINFVMNLYLLMLVNQSTLRTATRRRMAVGACTGAVIYLVPFMLGIPSWVKWPTAFLAGTGLMVEIAFRPRSFTILLRIIRQLFWYSFLMGGLLLAAEGMMPFLRPFMTGICGILGLGTLAYWLIAFLVRTDRRKRGNSICKATLINGETQVCVTALLDSGNSLREPVSGKPVSVIDRGLYRALWGEEEIPYRVVPYHSIGKAGGILPGYLLPMMEVELDGVVRRLQNVYVAVCEEDNSVGIILNPAVLGEDIRDIV
ncbi:MAG: sigma-E processing peptidase SpoIIGA [Butyrivibrio sp.]|nr:sigma-E processing peptidase SpoIIGA [Muribaculum sp.]MCM1551420.1 sigma-E processing peptidase SpoIIGA [Butyrivibrio sp.]